MLPRVVAAMVLRAWRREIAAPLDCEPELDKRRLAGGHIGSDDGSIRPVNWRPLTSTRTDTTASRSAWIRWMGRQAVCPLHLLVGVCSCLAGDEVGRPKGEKQMTDKKRFTTIDEC